MIVECGQIGVRNGDAVPVVLGNDGYSVPSVWPHIAAQYGHVTMSRVEGIEGNRMITVRFLSGGEARTAMRRMDKDWETAP